jgi:hypothetical protein
VMISDDRLADPLSVTIPIRAGPNEVNLNGRQIGEGFEIIRQGRSAPVFFVIALQDKNS